MSFKRAFSAVLIAFSTVLAFSLTAFSETADYTDSSEVSGEAEETEVKVITGNLSDVTQSFDAENEVYYYSFSDGASFYSTDIISEERNRLKAIIVGTEDDDVEITAKLNGEPLEVKKEYFFSEDGYYEFYITHELRNDGGSAVARFTVTVNDNAEDTPERQTTMGRISLKPKGDGQFVHTFNDGSEFVTNILDGETVNFTPKLVIPENVTCSVTRNGGVYSMPANGIISEDGIYDIGLTSVDSDGNYEKRSYSFSVFSAATNMLGIYQPPRGYKITSVTLYGREIPFENQNCVILDDQGCYDIRYTDGETERSVSLTRDTIPPVLQFNDSFNVVFDDSVTIKSDSFCTYEVTKNGQAFGNTTNLVGAGVYRVKAIDEAGNETSIRIEIRAVSVINPMDFVIIGGAIIVAAVIYFIVQKKRKITVR